MVENSAVQTGALAVLAALLAGLPFAFKYLLNMHREQMKEQNTANNAALLAMAASNEKAYGVMATEVKAGFLEVRAGLGEMKGNLDKRDEQVERIMDKHLAVTVEVTKAQAETGKTLGALSVEVSRLSRESAEVKAIVEKLKPPKGGTS